MPTNTVNYTKAASNYFIGFETLRKSDAKEIASTAQLVWTLRSLSAIALSLSVYLAWVALSLGKVAGCGSGVIFDCSSILQTKWSTVFGVPVSLPAVVLYASILCLLMVPSTSNQLAGFRWSLISFAAFSAAISGLWFVALQFLWLQHLCPYCLAIHVCGLIFAGIIAWKAPAGRGNTWRLAAFATLPVGLLIGSQISTTAAENFELIEHDAGTREVAPALTVPHSDNLEINGDADVIFESPSTRSDFTQSSTFVYQIQMEIISLLNPSVWLTGHINGPPTGQNPRNSKRTELDGSKTRRTAKILNNVALDVEQWPLLGRTDAKYVFVEMLDYTCQHCQNTHVAVRGAMEKYGDELAVLVLPVPLNASCNPHVKTTATQHIESCQLAKLAIAVWHLEPDKFEDFHTWLLESKSAYALAFQHAVQLVGEDRLTNELQSSVPSDFIAKIVMLYQRAGGGAVPKIMFPTSSAVGEMRSSGPLILLIEKELSRGN